MIDDTLFLKTDYFTPYFLKYCKQNPNVPQGISKYTKNIVKKLAIEVGLYSKVVKI